MLLPVARGGNAPLASLAYGSTDVLCIQLISLLLHYITIDHY